MTATVTVAAADGSNCPLIDTRRWTIFKRKSIFRSWTLVRDLSKDCNWRTCQSRDCSSRTVCAGLWLHFTSTDATWNIYQHAFFLWCCRWTRRKEKTPFRPVAKEVVEGKPEVRCLLSPHLPHFLTVCPSLFIQVQRRSKRVKGNLYDTHLA